MLHASHRSLFLDYHRVPYRVSAGPVGPTAASLPFLGRLTAAAGAADGTPALVWPRADAQDQFRGTARLGRHRLGNSWLVGHVVPEAAAVRWLARIGRGWRPVHQVRDPRGAHVSSVWRDETGSVFLPFDIDEVMLTLWSERYREVERSRAAAGARAALLRGYYLVKPVVPRSTQLALRRGFTRVQEQADFPRWPVEDSLHDLYDWLLSVLADVSGAPLPSLAPWPGGRSWALVLTHDVETETGYRTLHLLRDPERAAGFRSSWNFVPERYDVDPSVLQRLRDEGCEVGVHGLRHDGRDLGSETLLQQRLPAIRSYADRWQAVGFRSPATQRVWEWMPRLGFDYDSSYTDTDPYEPQPGGCCSHLPFPNGDQVELPITLPQDHTLFAVLQHADGRVWLDKARHLRDRGGMALVLAHPDYASDPRVLSAWCALLEEFRDDATMWHALPREVVDWWRRRAASSVRADGSGWRVDGPAAPDATVRLTVPGASLRVPGAVS
ncbi:hypothetical protein [Modestobacter sp. URMC 112]